MTSQLSSRFRLKVGWWVEAAIVGSRIRGGAGGLKLLNPRDLGRVSNVPADKSRLPEYRALLLRVTKQLQQSKTVADVRSIRQTGNSTLLGSQVTSSENTESNHKTSAW